RGGEAGLGPGGSVARVPGAVVDPAREVALHGAAGRARLAGRGRRPGGRIAGALVARGGAGAPHAAAGGPRPLLGGRDRVVAARRAVVHVRPGRPGGDQALVEGAPIALDRDVGQQPLVVVAAPLR